MRGMLLFILLLGLIGSLAELILLGHYEDWKPVPAERLALIILLDQFPRNIFRGTAEAFRHDALAMALAREGVQQGQLSELSVPNRHFF